MKETVQQKKKTSEKLRECKYCNIENATYYNNREHVERVEYHKETQHKKGRTEQRTWESNKRTWESNITSESDEIRTQMISTKEGNRTTG